MSGYDEDAQSALDLIQEAGGPVTIYRPGETVPTDPALPWEGNDEPGPGVSHVAAFVPFSSVEANQSLFADTAIIPAKGLDFELTKGLRVLKASGELVAIDNLQCIKPDGLTPIVYICEVRTWAGI